MKLNSISHFTSLDSFKKIILMKSFIPKYNKEDITHQIDSSSLENPSFFIPMVCFCDTGINITEHIKIYGGLGLGFDRSWAIDNGLVPVMYIHPNSKLISKIDFLMNEIAMDYSNSTKKNRPLILERHKSLFILTLFTKRYEGFFERALGVYIFYNEREWRYIPKLESQVEYSFNDLIINDRNEKMSNEQSYHLTFEFEDLKAIYATEDKYSSLKKFLEQNELFDLSAKINIVNV